ncbi:MAG: PIN domain-containing protein [Planctomycetes bacterium]|nr:PIN domain-containing protein [Planctomycetota bacterium]
MYDPRVVRVYFNTSALNRPFDDLSSARVRREAEAVASLIAAVESGRIEWLASDYLEYEIAQTPDLDRRGRVQALVAGSTGPRVTLSPRIAVRARELERAGLRGLDALHVAAAEAGGAALLVTTDDRMIQRARRAANSSSVRVIGPIDALAELMKGDER